VPDQPAALDCQGDSDCANIRLRMERLLLFDIDGTLTRTQNGYLPFNEAIFNTFGFYGGRHSHSGAGRKYRSVDRARHPHQGQC